MFFSIQKSFDFCYGHRVYTQQLDERFANTTECKCRHLHGHQGKLEVHLRMSALRLNEQGMVTDFAHLNWLKIFIDRYFDHKMILSMDDPLVQDLVELYPNDGDFNLDTIGFNFKEEQVASDADFYIMNALAYRRSHIRELFQGITLIKTVPTSELLSKFFFELVENKFESDTEREFVVERVVLWETPKSYAAYYGS